MSVRAPFTRNVPGAAAALTLALTVALVVALVPGATEARRPLPADVRLPAGTAQVVTVTSPGWAGDRSRIRVWERRGSGWALVGGPWRARLGPGGWVPARRRVQSTGTTPAGTFRLPYAFGLRRDPGTSLEYRRVDGDDWWPYEPRDPATYNIWQPSRSPQSAWRPGYAEHLASYPVDYALGVVVGFNLPSGVRWSAARQQYVTDRPADTRRGGGIFLHVWDEPNTAGCVSIAPGRLEWLLRWLDPARRPRIVMGPDDWVRAQL